MTDRATVRDSVEERAGWAGEYGGRWRRSGRRWIIAFVAVLMLAVAAPAIAAPDAETLPAGATFRDCPDCPEMVVIPAGEFLMGSSPAETARDLAEIGFFDLPLAKDAITKEHPQHLVRIRNTFGLGRFPVTRGEFAVFSRETGYSPAGGCVFYFMNKYRKSPNGLWNEPGFSQTDRDPVVCVNWQDAQAYVDWLNKRVADGIVQRGHDSYRLPSESEWEYAARAGQRTTRWWGDAIGQNNADCDGCGSAWDRRTTAPVSSFRANPFGVFDVLGNVWEWTADCWNWNYDTAPSDGGRQIIGDIEKRVMRGGSWNSSTWVLRSAHRTGIDAHERANDIGFRVARTLP